MLRADATARRSCWKNLRTLSMTGSTKMYLSKEIFDHLRTSFASLAGASVNTQINQALLEQPSVEWPWKRTRVNDAGREQHSLEFQIELRSQCAH